MVPRGTHDWRKFLTPDELSALLAEAGLPVVDKSGLSFDPRTGFVVSPSLALDYFITARKG